MHRAGPAYAAPRLRQPHDAADETPPGWRAHHQLQSFTGLEGGQLALAPFGNFAGYRLQQLAQAFLYLLLRGEYQHDPLAFAKHDALAFRHGNEGVITHAIDIQLDFPKAHFQLAAFAAGQYGSAEMVANFQFQALFIVYHHRTFCVDFGHVQAFGILFGYINEAALEQLGQFTAQVAEGEQRMGIKCADCL